jgi:hypothetical protein
VAEGRTLPDHDRCDTHRHYKLNCAQYEDLLAACSQLCQICGRSAERHARPKLRIDHEWGGLWAVRGLLCAGCNANLRQDGQGWSVHERYLATPWWKAQCAKRGLPAGKRPEPEIGSAIQNQWDTVWLHARQGWWHAFKQNGVGRGTKPWDQLNDAYGPHNLVPFDVTTSAERYSDLYWIQWEIDHHPKFYDREDIHRAAAGLRSAEAAHSAGVLF